MKKVHARITSYT